MSELSFNDRTLSVASTSRLGQTDICTGEVVNDAEEAVGATAERNRQDLWIEGVRARPSWDASLVASRCRFL
jgi:hypothetical protein